MRLFTEASVACMAGLYNQRGYITGVSRFPSGKAVRGFVAVCFGVGLFLFVRKSGFCAVCDKILSFLFCFSSFMVTFAVKILSVTYKVISL